MASKTKHMTKKNPVKADTSSNVELSQKSKRDVRRKTPRHATTTKVEKGRVKSQKNTKER